jgi:hypothetical protein
MDLTTDLRVNVYLNQLLKKMFPSSCSRYFYFFKVKWANTCCTYEPWTPSPFIHMIIIFKLITWLRFKQELVKEKKTLHIFSATFFLLKTKV